MSEQPKSNEPKSKPPAPATPAKPTAAPPAKQAESIKSTAGARKPGEALGSEGGRQRSLSENFANKPAAPFNVKDTRPGPGTKPGSGTKPK